MPIADYAHWNEDAERVWWQEEGRHVEEPPEPDDDEMFAHRWDECSGCSNPYCDDCG